MRSNQPIVMNDGSPALSFSRSSWTPRVVAAAGIACGLAAVQARSQEPVAQFRSGVELVQLDVTVLDRSREPISGLTKDDFTVLENGTPQEIVVFAERHAIQDAGRTASPPGLGAGIEGFGRTVLLLLDDTPTPSVRSEFLDLWMVYKTREIARSILSRLGPADRAAVWFVSGRGGRDDFSLDRSAAMAMAGGFGPEARAGSLRHALDQAVSAFLETPDGGRLIVYVGAGAPVGAALGRRSTVLMPMNSGPPLTDLHARARREHVVIHCIDAYGLGGLEPRLVQRGRPMATELAYRQSREFREFLQTVAHNTGGEAVINTNDFKAGIDRLLRQSAVHYLIGFRSSHPEADGRDRRIQVRVARRGAVVQARTGYVAPTELMLAEREAARRARLRARPVTEALAVLPDARSSSELRASAVAVPAGIDVTVELSREVSAAAQWVGAQVTVAVRGPARATVSEDIEPHDRSARVRVPLPQMPPGTYRLYVDVTNGDVTLADDVTVTVAESALVGAPRMLRRPSAGSWPFVPTGDPRFRRTERLRLEWPVFEAPDRHGARLLDRKGGVLAVPLLTETTDGHDGTGWITADLPLAPFAHGDYVVELTAARGTEEQRLTSAFRVVR